jgi:hypothetical protein
MHFETLMYLTLSCEMFVGQDIVVQGSLGGLQVLDLTPEGQMHQRILSLGKDPLVERNVDLVSCLDAELYSMCQQPTVNSEENRAFSFSVRRPLERVEPGNMFLVFVRHTLVKEIRFHIVDYLTSISQ